MSAAETEILLHVLSTHGPALRARARGIVRDAHVAEDLVQEAVSRLVAHPPRSRTEASFAGLLFRAVHDLAHRERRRRRREKGAELEAAERSDRAQGGSARRDDVVEGAIRGEASAAVRALLRLMTLLEQQVVTVVHLEGRTIPEAAARLGLHVTVVHRALGRACWRLGRWCWPRLTGAADPSDMAAIFKWVAPLRAPLRASTGSFELAASARESVA